MQAANLIAQYEDVICTPDEDIQKSARLSELGDLFSEQYELLHDVVALDMAISAQEDALRLTQVGHPARPLYMDRIGGSLLSRFKRLGKEDDIDKSVTLREDAVRLTSDGHPYKPAFLSNLGGSYKGRFEHLGHLTDIDKSIGAHEAAAKTTPERHPSKVVFLSNLGGSLTRRFERLGNLEDIEKSIEALGRAVRLSPDRDPRKHGCLSNLGTALLCRFERLGNLEDIDKSIGALEDATRLIPQGDPEKPMLLANLGGSLMTRFERLGKVGDIDKSIALREAAVQLIPDGDPRKPGNLNSLGTSLTCRFERLRKLDDIDRSIVMRGDAVRLSPDGHPSRYMYLSCLGTSLMRRFEHLGKLDDIDKSIALQEDGVGLIPDGHPDKPTCLSNLGASFTFRFERLEKLEDIDKSIAVKADAVRLMPDGHPDKPKYMSNLGAAFVRRFERLKKLDDIDRAIALHQDAVRLTPDGHSYKLGHMGNLGGSLMTRFVHQGNLVDIDKSIEVLKGVVRRTPDGHPYKLKYLRNLGGSFMHRFKRLGKQDDLHTATLHFARAARTLDGPPRDRFQAASAWANCCLNISASSSLDAYRYALDMLPRVAWLGLSMAERHTELAEIGKIVREAAAAAVESEEYDTALEWLEQGRSIVWGQLLNLRTPVDLLRAHDSALADRLEQVSKELEHTSTRDTIIETIEPSSKPSHQPSMEEISQRHHRLAGDYENLVEHIRTLPGFEDFLKPKKLAHFRSAARSGPVVAINTHRSRCDALVLMADLEEVIHIPLDNFSQSRAEQLQQSLEGLLSGRGFRERSGRDPVRDSSPSDDNQFMAVLSELWFLVVKPVLESLAFSISPTGDPPRIWWCPTGPLTFLPLHAAGCYDTDEPGHKVSDFVASSYTPTLAALLDTPRTRNPDTFQLLAIAQPSTPGQSFLPNTTQELIHIRKHADRLPVLSLEGAQATVGRVVEGMKKCTWIHLACHGAQDINDSTKSSFFLQDGQLELSEIIKTPLPNAEFAFLSACKTATGDKRISEEAVHLAAGMLLAGYRGVVATTWSIMDNDAPLVADKVYARLFKDHPPDSTHAALALHHAVQQLRERKHVSAFSWVPFIHVGM